ncbi:MAG: thioesterase family protein [Verrucomicrobia bacterium]|nr:thioesterase family protein [Verrucomicrobiota bacterium]
MAKCLIQRRVEYADTDMAGIVHYSAFFRYMESAEHELFRRAGLSVVMQDAHRQLSWPRVACAFEYNEPLRFEDEFDVSIWIAKMGNKSLTFHAEILGARTIHATGSSTSVCCVISEGGMVSSIPIPDDIRAPLSAFLVED